MVSGFAASGRLTATTGLTRPKRVHAFALRLTSSPSRAPTARLPAPPPSRLHGERAIAMGSSFQLTRSARLSLTHQKVTKLTKGGTRAGKAEEAPGVTPSNQSQLDHRARARLVPSGGGVEFGGLSRRFAHRADREGTSACAKAWRRGKAARGLASARERGNEQGKRSPSTFIGLRWLGEQEGFGMVCSK
jgi:hypothetical protein